MSSTPTQGGNQGTDAVAAAIERHDAYHEAGHAVAYLLFGRTLRYVAIRLPGSYSGETVPVNAINIHADDPRPELAIVRAGWKAAENLFIRDGGAPDDAEIMAIERAQDDVRLYEKVRCCARRTGADPGNAHWWQTFDEALANPMWPTVEAVAEQLLADSRLEGEELAAMVAEHGDGWSAAHLRALARHDNGPKCAAGLC